MRKLGFALGLGIATLTTLAAGPASADPLEQNRRWGIGLRTTSQKVAPESMEENKLKMEGGGLQFRYRLNRRWSLELSSENIRTKGEDGAAYTREASPVTFTALWHMSPQRRWDWYLLFGVGGTNANVTYRTVNGAMATETFKEAHVHLGVGVERTCGHFGIGAELRAVGLSRNDEEEAGAAYQGLDYGPVPANESGGQFNLTATYYF